MGPALWVGDTSTAAGRAPDLGDTPPGSRAFTVTTCPSLLFEQLLLGVRSLLSFLSSLIYHQPRKHTIGTKQNEYEARDQSLARAKDSTGPEEGSHMSRACTGRYRSWAESLEPQSVIWK